MNIYLCFEGSTNPAAVVTQEAILMLIHFGFYQAFIV